MKARIVIAVLALTACVQAKAALVLSEDFDDPILEGWAAANFSTPGGTTSWFLGNPGVFPAHAGAADSYAAANSLAAPLGGDIDNWLFMPVLDYSATGPVELSFFTRSGGAFPDRLEIYASSAGGGTNTSDFALLLSINPALDYSYPTDWAQFLATYSGTGSGRFAFRYWVTDTNVNADYIGIDTIRVNTVPEPGTLGLLALGLFGFAVGRRTTLGRVSN